MYNKYTELIIDVENKPLRGVADLEQMLDRNVIDFEKWKRMKDTKKINKSNGISECAKKESRVQNNDNHRWIMAMVCIICLILAIIK